MTSDVWWERDAEGEGRITNGRPELVDATREAVRSDIRDRIPGYTPDWTNPDRQDAGVALVRLFGTQVEPVLTRVNRLPEKILAEHLNTAGVRRRAATAAAALLQFTVTPPDGRSVLVPAGFQAAASGPDGQIIYETDHDLFATPAALAALATEEDGSFDSVPLTGRAFAPFGLIPTPGNGLWIGLAGTASPFPSISLGFVVQAGVPEPAASPAALEPGPLLRWDVLDGSRFVPADVVRDDTSGLTVSGTLELRVPRDWAPASRLGRSMRWLRVQIAHGEFAQPPVLAGVRLNTVSATAARTIRDEPLQPIQDPGAAGRRRMRLSQVPILPGTVEIEVDDDPGADVFGTTTDPRPKWREVDSLAGFGADDRVFVVDYATGEVTFGDGINGAAVPPGFRNVRAIRYRVGGGSSGAVRANAVSSVVTALPFVTGVTNPFAASGGTDPEPDADAIRRGVGELRSRGRAVAPADYGLLAVRAPGAEIARAHGVPGLHPDFAGKPIPGVVGVLVVAPTGEPPIPAAATLHAVANFLTREVAPAGVTVVAAPAVFHDVAVEAWVVVDEDQDRAGVLARAGDALTTYLDPVRGGEDGAGWPFGGALRHSALVRRLLTVGGIIAVSQLSLTVDGLRLPPCTDHVLPPNTLVWPRRPLLIPVGGTP
ncbi:putative baseplate assembly protein [Actinocrispum sp. NPDC049592]|uniref:putative baseplate assembly protein n=1 Tax=Actinocrispum sp. NPDC049592 TaxID=3154835 RepID=UPI00341A55B6